MLVFYLVALSVAAAASWSRFNLWEWARVAGNMLLLVGSAAGTYALIVRMEWAKPTRIEHRIITACLLFLLFDPLLPWWSFLALGMGVELLQRGIRTATGPVCNPAALAGLLSAIAGVYPGWWGMSFSPRLPLITGGVSSAVLLIPVAAYVAYKYRKLTIVASYLLVFAITYFIVFSKSPVFVLVEGTILFFALVMIIEPKTSPILPIQQVIFGSLVALLHVPLLYWYAPDPALGALVVANIGWWGWRKWTVAQVQVQTQA